MKHSGCSTRVLTIVTLVLFTVTSIDAYAYVSIPPNHSPSFVVGGTSNIPSASSCFAPDNRNPMSCRQTYINTNPRTRTSCTAWATKTSLHLSSKNNNEEPEDSKNEVDPNLKKEDTPTSMSMSSITRKMTVIWKLLITKFMNFFPTFRVALASFTVGAVLALSLIFIPVYNAVDKMSEPVTLFETILADLDAGYVDDVDTKKLFETGVSAMLRSLDPYTEFEGRQEAQDLNESVSGKYGGIGLVITGTALPKPVVAAPAASESGNIVKSGSGGDSKILPKEALNDNALMIDDDTIAIDDDDEDLLSGVSASDRAQLDKDQQKAYEKAAERGIRVVNAFEGYAFDYGMRPGDKIVAVDGWRVGSGSVVEDVRNRLRGDPGSTVDITIERERVTGETTLTIPRTEVQIADVKLAAMIGKESDGIGYIQLAGFTGDAGREVRNSILSLQRAAEQASGGKQSLQGLILDLRGNPGGLLTSAVDVSSLLVPKGSEIVSARGRGFPGVTYKSRVDPILDPSTKLAVLVNDSTASAAEIVSGAIQDLDVGVIVGSSRTFGKGLVQNVEELPFDTALKFTVAKYYTPSGRCIQSTNYSNGGGLDSTSDGKYKATKVADKDKAVFYTTNGRQVRDGGGVAVDYKVDAPKASALEVTLLRSNVIVDFAAEWSKKYDFTENFAVDDALYREFQDFVMKQNKEGDIKLDAIYSGPIKELRKSLERSEYQGSTKELKQLEASIMRDMSKDFEKYKKDIKEDVETGILSRYIPESMLINRSIQTDQQVLGALKIIGNQKQFNKLLSRADDTDTKIKDDRVLADSSSTMIGLTSGEEGAKMKLKF